MKKSLILALLIFGIILNAKASLSVSVNKSNAELYNKVTKVSAFDFNLCNDERFLINDSQTLSEKITLKDVTIKNFSIYPDLGYCSNIGLAIYEANNKHTSWSFIGKSNWLTGVTDKLSFSFENLTLNSESTYTAIFYGDFDTFNQLSTENRLSNWTGVKYGPSASNPIVAVGFNFLYNFTDDSMGRSVYNENGELITSVFNSNYQATTAYFQPDMTFTLTNIVPEPTTSSLGLLGLTVLFIRRRRI